MLLHDKLKPYRLILASQSPRRQQLLAESGLPYEPAPRYDCQAVSYTHLVPKIAIIREISLYLYLK